MHKPGGGGMGAAAPGKGHIPEAKSRQGVGKPKLVRSRHVEPRRQGRASAQ